MQTIKGIYIPGLGDNKPRGQDQAVRDWHKHGLDLTYFPLGWADGEPFDKKLGKLLDKIDQLYSPGNKIVLIGSSAGASAVLNAYTMRKDKVASVVYICGKIQNAESIPEKEYITNPAFKGSMQMLKANLQDLGSKDLKKILSVVPLYDGRVPVHDTKIRGVKEMRIPFFGHAISIAFALIFYKRPITKFVRDKIKLDI